VSESAEECAVCFEEVSVIGFSIARLPRMAISGNPVVEYFMEIENRENILFIPIILFISHRFKNF